MNIAQARQLRPAQPVLVSGKPAVHIAVIEHPNRPGHSRPLVMVAPEVGGRSYLVRPAALSLP